MKISKSLLNIEKIEIEVDKGNHPDSYINSPQIEEFMRLRTININNVRNHIINMKVIRDVYLCHMIVIVTNNMIVSLV